MALQMMRNRIQQGRSSCENIGLIQRSLSGIDWDDPCISDLCQDNDTEKATQAYTGKGRTPEVLAVLATYGFTDFSKDIEQQPSPCFEKAVRMHCSQRGGGGSLPSITVIADAMRAEASE
jgi:hypothetical protein